MGLKPRFAVVGYTSISGIQSYPRIIVNRPLMVMIFIMGLPGVTITAGLDSSLLLSSNLACQLLLNFSSSPFLLILLACNAFAHYVFRGGGIGNLHLPSIVSHTAVL